MKNKGKSFKAIINDNVYMLKFVKKGSPYFITMTLLVSLTAFVDTLSNTWLSKAVFDGMSQGIPYKNIVIVVLTLLGMMLVTTTVRSWFYQKKTPVAHEKIRFYIRSSLFGKAKSLDLCCFEDSGFYDKYTRAYAEADNRAFNVLSSVSSLSYSIVSLLTLFSIILYLEPILILFALIGALLLFIIGKKSAKLRYDFNYGKTTFDRKNGYTHRVFFEPQYAKDMKMDNMYSYFIRSYKNTIVSLIDYIRKKQTKSLFVMLLYHRLVQSCSRLWLFF